MKIIDPQYSVLNQIHNARKNKRTIVFTNGCFDTLHLGHIKFLENCKKLGNFLVVAINSDYSVKKLKENSRPFNNQNDRKTLLSSIRYVDAVIIYDDLRATEAIKYCRPDVYVKSADYSIENMDEPELKALQEIGAKIVFTP